MIQESGFRIRFKFQVETEQIPFKTSKPFTLDIKRKSVYVDEIDTN